MSKILKKHGKTTSKPEVLNISHQGVWVLVHDQEFFLPFKDFPWFLKATLDQIYTLELFHEKHLHWPLLDVDIDIGSLEHMESYPLYSKK